MVLECQSRQ
ncbi:hypothetical protein MTR67_012223 [Solanum verrucosum]|uniref:Uncharacterized protein n=1 Tax=Solanum verrucosum TaxID=315347 RepID=A0AAF0Q9B6_SOLVR|nr:hypothetical protein MTR67_012223 [Solanum verrucosum]